MTEDAAIRIDFESAEFVHVTTLWSYSSIQHPGTCPTGSLELAPQEWTRTSPTKPDYRVTSLRTHQHTVLGIPVVGCPLLPPTTTSHLVATCPTGTSAQNTMDLEIITTYQARVACVHNIP